METAGTHLEVPGTNSFDAIVMDVDGTMVGADFVVSERLRRAVEAAQQHGAIVSLATGRMMRSARRFSAQAGATGPVICYQGALTLDLATNTVLRHERLPEDVALEALRIFAEARSHINVYVDDEVYVEHVTPWAEGYASRMEITLRRVDSLEELAGRGPTLILGVDEAECIDRLLPEVTAKLGERARVTHSLPRFCEVGSPGAGKERALEALSTRLRVKPSSFIAFGDGKGDAGMLEWAGLGVAVRGSHPDTLAVAGMVAPGPEEDGVAQVIESLLEQGRLGRA